MSRFQRLLRRAVLASALCGVLVFAASCYGPFRMTKKLHGWNGRVSENPWVVEIVFLGLNILPAYWFTTMADAFVLNSIEFWTGDNPLRDPSAIPPVDGDAGSTTTTPDADPDVDATSPDAPQ